MPSKGASFVKKFFCEGQVHDDQEEVKDHVQQLLHKHRKTAAVGIPFVIVEIIWLITAYRYDWLYLYSEYWPLAIFMIAVGIVIGLLNEGGGSFLFLGMTLIFGTDSVMASDFVLIIQALCLSCTVFSIFYKKLHIDNTALLIAFIGTTVGFITGSITVLNFDIPFPLEYQLKSDTSLKETIILTAWLAFAIGLFTLYRGDSRRVRLRADIGRIGGPLLFFTGLLGGVVMSLAGTGAEFVLFTVMTLFFRASKRVTTATGIVLLGTDSVFKPLKPAFSFLAAVGCSVIFSFFFFRWLAYVGKQRFLKIAVGITVLLMLLFGLYMQMYHAPRHLSKTFKNLILLHGVVLALSCTYFTWFATPTFLLPYLAYHGTGVLTILGIPQNVQIKISFCIFFGNGSSIMVLFFYRMNILLPCGHILNKLWVRCVFYGVTYPFMALFSIPFIDLCLNTDMYSVKLLMFEEYRVVHPDIFNMDVSCVIYGSSNPATYFFTATVALVAIYGLTVVFYSCITIYQILNRNTRHFSEHAKRQHSEVMTALISMTTVFTSLVVFSIGPILFLVITRSWRADILAYALLYVPIDCIICILVYHLTYRPYKRVIWKAIMRAITKTPKPEISVGAVNQ